MFYQKYFEILNVDFKFLNTKSILVILEPNIYAPLELRCQAQDTQENSSSLRISSSNGFILLIRILF